ncbi:conserved Plasmodium protein, unknown function [Plasmodium malariae]|uniref:Uncharacterized protein n=2 Tax=Plasmodium (Plasmodium) TaxID=418103 RepID=A0A1D3PBG2_PLAMA|nr:conserved Plasmodium protein, unknown function [Plasmodium malariae]SCN12609.1 conserved Plasmodium protein, unknown function [Plasmodium malariae]
MKNEVKSEGKNHTISDGKNNAKCEGKNDVTKKRKDQALKDYIYQNILKKDIFMNIFKGRNNYSNNEKKKISENIEIAKKKEDNTNNVDIIHNEDEEYMLFLSYIYNDVTSFIENNKDYNLKEFDFLDTEDLIMEICANICHKTYNNIKMMFNKSKESETTFHIDSCMNEKHEQHSNTSLNDSSFFFIPPMEFVVSYIHKLQYGKGDISRGVVDFIRSNNYDKHPLLYSCEPNEIGRNEVKNEHVNTRDEQGEEQQVMSKTFFQKDCPQFTKYQQNDEKKMCMITQEKSLSVEEHTISNNNEDVAEYPCSASNMCNGNIKPIHANLDHFSFHNEKKYDNELKEKMPISYMLNGDEKRNLEFWTNHKNYINSVHKTQLMGNNPSTQNITINRNDNFEDFEDPHSNDISNSNNSDGDSFCKYYDCVNNFSSNFFSAEVKEEHNMISMNNEGKGYTHFENAKTERKDDMSISNCRTMRDVNLNIISNVSSSFHCGGIGKDGDNHYNDNEKFNTCGSTYNKEHEDSASNKEEGEEHTPRKTDSSFSSHISYSSEAIKTIFPVKEISCNIQQQKMNFLNHEIISDHVKVKDIHADVKVLHHCDYNMDEDTNDDDTVGGGGSDIGSIGVNSNCVQNNDSTDNIINTGKDGFPVSAYDDSCNITSSNYLSTTGKLNDNMEEYNLDTQGIAGDTNGNSFENANNGIVCLPKKECNTREEKNRTNYNAAATTCTTTNNNDYNNTSESMSKDEEDGESEFSKKKVEFNESEYYEKAEKRMINKKIFKDEDQKEFTKNYNLHDDYYYFKYLNKCENTANPYRYTKVQKKANINVTPSPFPQFLRDIQIYNISQKKIRLKK